MVAELGCWPAVGGTACLLARNWWQSLAAGPQFAAHPGCWPAVGGGAWLLARSLSRRLAAAGCWPLARSWQRPLDAGLQLAAGLSCWPALGAESGCWPAVGGRAWLLPYSWWRGLAAGPQLWQILAAGPQLSSERGCLFWLLSRALPNTLGLSRALQSYPWNRFGKHKRRQSSDSDLPGTALASTRIDETFMMTYRELILFFHDVQQTKIYIRALSMTIRRNCSNV